jgi:DNA (cytosine-5)-methyltransferase 1
MGSPQMSARAYYNENNPYCAQWLRNLIANKLIAVGDVDERSIIEVKLSDLKGYTQCHFFAGIGGWSLALRMIGWPDARSVWSASVPCQPWSRARMHNMETTALRDERDLWPIFFKLFKAARPDALIGEQVAGAQTLEWIKRMRSDLFRTKYDIYSDRREASDYGSSQKRTRLYFFANPDDTRRERLVASEAACQARSWRWGGAEDMRAIAAAPFESGDRWPQPLLRRGDDGLSARVGGLRAFGNAIDPFVASRFLIDALKTEKRGMI